MLLAGGIVEVVGVTFDFEDLPGFGLYPVSIEEGCLVEEGRGVQLYKEY